MVVVLFVFAVLIALILCTNKNIKNGWYKPIKIEGALELSKNDVSKLKQGYLLYKNIEGRHLEVYLDIEADKDNIKESDIIIKHVGRRS